jgi:protein PhnA
MSDEMKPCPACQCPYGYTSGEEEYTCPECSHVWQIANNASKVEVLVIKDSNGNQLQDGDSVIVIKDLPVKGAKGPIKAGTKVKNIRLVDAEHDIDCKIPGYGAMGLKSALVKKA